MAQQFGWFLFLNKANSFCLSINGEPIDFDHLIADTDARKLTINSSDGKEHHFLINYIRWHDAIGDRYYYYFLNHEKRESAKKLTSFNNNAIEFHHSVFAQSDFFDKFILSEDNPNSSLFEKNQTDPVYKQLLVSLNAFLTEKQKTFIRETAADDLVRKLEAKGVFPKFGRGKYDTQRKEDLVSVVKELYIVEPKIFKKLNKQQEVTFLGFLNLLLDSDEREKILQIIDELVRLSSSERDELSLVLKKTSFSKISKTIRLIESRFEVVELLRMLVFDNKRFTTERDHIQSCIEENYWLFGEQFHLVSADKNFQTALSEYLHLIDGVEGKAKVGSYDWKRRPDIFICRKRNITDPRNSDNEIEENIMVELKRPTVTIGKTQLRQVDDYLDLILKEDGFNSELRTWKFFVVSNKVDEYIKKEYEAFADKGKRFLVKKVGRYEIYAVTWDDVFKSFEIKHNYLLDKLAFDKTALKAELESKGVNLGRDSADFLSKEVIDLAKN